MMRRRLGERLRQNRRRRKRGAAQHAMEFAGCGGRRGRIAGIGRSCIAAAEAEHMPSGEVGALRMGGQRRESREQGLERDGVSRDQPDRGPETPAFDETRHSNPTQQHPYQR
jgi:hypothetical protein